MRIALAFAAAMFSAASSAAGPLVAPTPPPRFEAAAPDRSCVSNDVHFAARREAQRPRTLGELPPGNVELAVLREVDGCREPVIVRQGFGAIPTETPQPQPSRR